MSSFQLQADMYNSITPPTVSFEEVKIKELEGRVMKLENKVEKLENTNAELEKKFTEELRNEFMKNHCNGDDIYESMLKGMGKVLANIYHELGGRNEQ